MTLDRRFLFGTLALAVGIVVWWAAWQAEPTATWIQVEAPEHAMPGTTFPVAVRLNPDQSMLGQVPMLIGVHLHSLTSRRQWRGYLASAPPQAIDTSSAMFQFEPVIPENKTFGFVFVLAFISPTGRWDDRVSAVASDEIPVLANAARETLDRLQPLAVRDTASRRNRRQPDATSIRVVLALGWLICGWLSWRKRDASERSNAGRILVPSLAIVAAVWELLPFEELIGEQARAFAVAHDWYELRREPQKFLTVTLALGTAATALFLLRRPSSAMKQLPLIGLTLHFGVMLTGFLSLHRVDSILGRGVFSLPLIQILQLGALLFALIGTANLMRRSSRAILRT